MNSVNTSLQNSSGIKLVRLYKQSLADIRIELDRMYQKFGNASPSLAQAGRMNQLSNMERSVQKILLNLEGDTTTVIQGSMENLYTKNFFVLPTTLNKELGINISLGVINEASVKQSLETPLQYLTRNSRMTNDKLREAITRNLINGESYPKLSKDVADIMGEGAGSAMRIARTEEHRVIAEARADSFDEVQSTGESIGIKLEKQWFATNDARGRHQFMDGQISVDGIFDFEGTPVAEPGSSEMGTESINCRCTSGIVLV